MATKGSSVFSLQCKLFLSPLLPGQQRWERDKGKGKVGKVKAMVTFWKLFCPLPFQQHCCSSTPAESLLVCRLKGMKNQFGQPFLQACPPLAQVRNLELLFCDALGVKESSVPWLATPYRLPERRASESCSLCSCGYCYPCANLLDLSAPLCLQAAAPESSHAILDW